MDSSSNRNFQDQSGSGLLRFRSAPITLLSSFEGQGVIGDDSPVIGFREFDGKSAAKVKGTANSGGGYPNSSPLARSFSGLPPHYPKSDTAPSGVDREGSYGLMMASLGINQNEAAAAVKTVDYSSLGRQSSSAAGFFEDLSSQNGNYPTLKGYNTTTRIGANNGGEASARQRSQHSFSSRISPSMALLSSSEIDLEHVSPSSPDSPSLGSRGGDGSFYGGAAGFPYGATSWNESHFADTTSLAHHHRQSGGEIGSGVHGLSRHLSLPKTSASSGEMRVMDTFLRFQDSVPCKIRAKRGCATHPRSIAERLRRTRISERMRKLEELVPNMDKQTNTADMLDLAVDYIKDLQTQYKNLNESRANCTCPHKQQGGQSQS